MIADRELLTPGAAAYGDPVEREISWRATGAEREQRRAPGKQPRTGRGGGDARGRICGRRHGDRLQRQLLAGCAGGRGQRASGDRRDRRELKLLDSRARHGRHEVRRHADAPVAARALSSTASRSARIAAAFQRLRLRARIRVGHTCCRCQRRRQDERPRGAVSPGPRAGRFERDSSERLIRCGMRGFAVFGSSSAGERPQAGHCAGASSGLERRSMGSPCSGAAMLAEHPAGARA